MNAKLGQISHKLRTTGLNAKSFFVFVSAEQKSSCSTSDAEAEISTDLSKDSFNAG